jgi:hypothetical protein
MKKKKTPKTAVIRFMIEPGEKDMAQNVLSERNETLSRFLQQEIYKLNRSK